MPTLPTAEALGVRSFQDRSQVVRPTVDTSGQDALVSAVSDISKNMNSRLDKSSLHKAKVHYQKAKLEADSAFDQDQDFETYQERYDVRMKSAMEGAAKMVRNPNDRTMFSESMSLYNAQGSNQIIAKAYSKEVDKGLADLNETLTIGRENYLRSSNPEDKAFARDTANEAINSVEEAGYIDADKAQSLRQSHALDLAVATVEVAPPEEKLKILKSDKGVMQYLPLDKRKAMIKSAEGQLDAQIALDTANVIRNEGGTLGERLAKVHLIQDPQIKAATKSQTINDFNLEKTVEGEAKYDAYDAMAKSLIAGDNLNSIRAEKPHEWAMLGSKEQAALINMSKSKKASKTDFTAYHKLNILKQEDKVKAYHYFLDNVSSFSEADAKKQSNYFTDLAEEPKPLFSMSQAFTKKAKSLKIKEASLGEAEHRIQEEYDTWAKANPGEEMDLKTQNGIVDSVFDRVADTSGWFSSDKRGFQLPKSKVDESKVKAIFAEYKVRFKKEPDTEMMMKITEKMIRDGLISDETK